MPLPLVSIVIPNYNREKLIIETLSSIQAQTYENWEAIIVDDGSTDGSEATVINYIKNDFRFKFFKRHRLPKGAPTCRNIGVENAKGSYVIFLDSDDLLAPFCLKQRVEFMEAHPELDFGVFMGMQFNKKAGDRSTLINIPTEEDDVARFLNYDTPWLMSNPIWRKPVLKDFPWNENLACLQDYLFNVLPVLEGRPYKFVITEPDCFWRRGSHDSITKEKNSIVRIESAKEVVDIIFSVVEKNHLIKKYKKQIVSSYLDVIYRSLTFGNKTIPFKILNQLRNNQMISQNEYSFLHMYVPLFLISKKSMYWRILKKGMSLVIGEKKVYKNYGTFVRVNKEDFYKDIKRN